jgi:mono/diheme cytochrome c family protein
MPLRPLLAAAVLFALLVPAAAPARAEGGDPEAGKAAAVRWCAQCHAVEATGQASDVAEPFAALARKAGGDGGRLEAFLADPHGNMPRIQLPRRDIRDIVAYILSLGK